MLELAESLLLAESVSPRALARGLFLEATQQMSLVQALIVTGAIDEAKIEEVVGKAGDPPPLGTITPSLSLVQRLPRGLCARLLAIPMGTDPQTGIVDVAVVDLRDPARDRRGRVLPARARAAAPGDRVGVARGDRADPARRTGARPDPRARRADAHADLGHARRERRPRRGAARGLRATCPSR